MDNGERCVVRQRAEGLSSNCGSCAPLTQRRVLESGPRVTITITVYSSNVGDDVRCNRYAHSVLPKPARAKGSPPGAHAPRQERPPSISPIRKERPVAAHSILPAVLLPRPESHAFRRSEQIRLEQSRCTDPRASVAVWFPRRRSRVRGAGCERAAACLPHLLSVARLRAEAQLLAADTGPLLPCPPRKSPRRQGVGKCAPGARTKPARGHRPCRPRRRETPGNTKRPFEGRNNDVTRRARRARCARFP